MRSLQVFEESLGPTIGRVLADVIVGNLKSLLFFILRHIDCKVYVLSDLINVEGVDFEYTTKGSVAARKLREDNRGLILALELLFHGDELQGWQALPVAEGSDQEDIAHGP